MIVLKDRPGEPARMGVAKGSAGVDIDGACAFSGEASSAPGVI